MCPPGVDWTMRGPQHWQILAPRLRQVERLSPKNEYYTGTPEEFLFDKKQSWGADFKLVRPVDTALALPREQSRIFHQSERVTILSSLEGMSTELLEMGLKDPTLEKQDIVAIGLCSTTLWDHVIEFVEASYRKTCCTVGRRRASLYWYLPHGFAKSLYAG